MAGRFEVSKRDPRYIAHGTIISARRYRTNLEAIIDKYNKPFHRDDIIDLESFVIENEVGRLKKIKKAQAFGQTQLASVKGRAKLPLAFDPNESGFASGENSKSSSKFSSSVFDSLDQEESLMRSHDESTVRGTAEEEIAEDFISKVLENESIVGEPEPSDGESIGDSDSEDEQDQWESEDDGIDCVADQKSSKSDSKGSGRKRAEVQEKREKVKHLNAKKRAALQAVNSSPGTTVHNNTFTLKKTSSKSKPKDEDVAEEPKPSDEEIFISCDSDSDLEQDSWQVEGDGVDGVSEHKSSKSDSKGSGRKRVDVQETEKQEKVKILEKRQILTAKRRIAPQPVNSCPINPMFISTFTPEKTSSSSKLDRKPKSTHYKKNVVEVAPFLASTRSENFDSLEKKSSELENYRNEIKSPRKDKHRTAKMKESYVSEETALTSIHMNEYDAVSMNSPQITTSNSPMAVSPQNFQTLNAGQSVSGEQPPHVVHTQSVISKRQVFIGENSKPSTTDERKSREAVWQRVPEEKYDWAVRERDVCRDKHGKEEAMDISMTTVNTPQMQPFGVGTNATFTVVQNKLPSRVPVGEFQYQQHEEFQYQQHEEFQYQQHEEFQYQQHEEFQHQQHEEFQYQQDDNALTDASRRDNRCHRQSSAVVIFPLPSPKDNHHMANNRHNGAKTSVSCSPRVLGAASGKVPVGIVHRSPRLTIEGMAFLMHSPLPYVMDPLEQHTSGQGSPNPFTTPKFTQETAIVKVTPTYPQPTQTECLKFSSASNTPTSRQIENQLDQLRQSAPAKFIGGVSGARGAQFSAKKRLVLESTASDQHSDMTLHTNLFANVDRQFEDQCISERSLFQPPSNQFCPIMESTRISEGAGFKPPWVKPADILKNHSAGIRGAIGNPKAESTRLSQADTEKVNCNNRHQAVPPVWNPQAESTRIMAVPASPSLTNGSDKWMRQSDNSNSSRSGVSLHGSRDMFDSNVCTVSGPVFRTPTSRPRQKTRTPSSRPDTLISGPCTPRARSLTPTSRSSTPGSRSNTLVPGSFTPSSRSHSPGARSLTPTSRSTTLMPGSCSPSSRSHSPKARSLTPTSRSTTPSSRSTTPSSKPFTPHARSVTPTMRYETPRSSKINPTSGRFAPDAQSPSEYIQRLQLNTPLSSGYSKDPNTPLHHSPKKLGHRFQDGNLGCESVDSGMDVSVNMEEISYETQGAGFEYSSALANGHANTKKDKKEVRRLIAVTADSAGYTRPTLDEMDDRRVQPVIADSISSHVREEKDRDSHVHKIYKTKSKKYQSPFQSKKQEQDDSGQLSPRVSPPSQKSSKSLSFDTFPQSWKPKNQKLESQISSEPVYPGTPDKQKGNSKFRRKSITSTPNKEDEDSFHIDSSDISSISNSSSRFGGMVYSTDLEESENSDLECNNSYDSDGVELLDLDATMGSKEKAQIAECSWSTNDLKDQDDMDRTLVKHSLDQSRDLSNSHDLNFEKASLNQEGVVKAAKKQLFGKEQMGQGQRNEKIHRAPSVKERNQQREMGTSGNGKPKFKTNGQRIDSRGRFLAGRSIQDDQGKQQELKDKQHSVQAEEKETTAGSSTKNKQPAGLFSKVSYKIKPQSVPKYDCEESTLKDTSFANTLKSIRGSSRHNLEQDGDYSNFGGESKRKTIEDPRHPKQEKRSQVPSNFYSKNLRGLGAHHDGNDVLLYSEDETARVKKRERQPGSVRYPVESDTGMQGNVSRSRHRVGEDQSRPKGGGSVQTDRYGFSDSESITRRNLDKKSKFRFPEDRVQGHARSPKRLWHDEPWQMVSPPKMKRIDYRPKSDMQNISLCLGKGNCSKSFCFSCIDE
ncbi:uncharacterized protein LOC106156701 [Lingula anatina]|uniref:Uncharacterized protein LOC106156701 n=1 Tax=Lingula anatina TaxID=7574 RepID=A0A1S3HPS0_LINAN|nr:uncharacterized protein LOC106156701 [Lingula anatina]|eukprot:XP_013387541.1 uncharacterized protein LOC106156701 [Lingula anatina]